MSLYTFLTSSDIKNVFKNKINVIPYNELSEYNTIDELLYPYGMTVILYLQAPNIGHWTCIWKNENKIFFFDSYGNRVDDDQSWITEKERKILYQNMRYLSILLKRAPYEIDYNQYKLQGPHVNTCGKWCCARLQLKHLSTDEFADLFKKHGNITPDMLVDFYYQKFLNPDNIIL
jgi:hypothetical protein